MKIKKILTNYGSLIVISIGLLSVFNIQTQTKYTLDYLDQLGSVFVSEISKGEVLGATTDGLIAHWKFDEGSGNSVTDSVTSFDGILSKSPFSQTAVIPSWVSGQINGALDFDGAGGFVQIQASNSIFATSTTDMSYSLWVNPDSNKASQTAFALKTAASSAGPSISVEANRMAAYYRNSSNQSVKIVGPVGGVPIGIWTHATVVIDDSNIKLYINGVFVSESNLVNSVNTFNLSSNESVIGTLANASGAFDGKIDEIRIYSRALTSQEVADIFISEGGTIDDGIDRNAPIISNISSGTPSDVSATITWITDEDSDTQIEYGLTSSYGQLTQLNNSLVKSHTTTITGLSANTVYHYRVISRDALGNVATSSDNTFTTTDPLPPDIDPPNISSLNSSNVDTDSATITWTTNELSDSKVEYGISQQNIISTPVNPSMVTSHSINLTGLNPNTNYQYRVISKDSSGNIATSSFSNFNTDVDVFDGPNPKSLIPVTKNDTLPINPKLYLRVGGPESRKTITDISVTKPIKMTVQNHGFEVGDHVWVSSVQGNTAANGHRIVKSVIDSNNFTLTDDEGNDLGPNGVALDVYTPYYGSAKGYVGKVEEYSFQQRPRLFLDGPNGTIASRVKDPDGVGPQIAPALDGSNPASYALNYFLESRGYGDSTGKYQLSAAITGDAVLNTAFAWYGDNSKSNYKNSAIDYINKVDLSLGRMSGGTFSACNINVLLCGYGSESDWASFTTANYAKAADLLWSEMTEQERSVFLDKIFNDFGDDCINLRDDSGNIDSWDDSKCGIVWFIKHHTYSGNLPMNVGPYIGKHRLVGNITQADISITFDGFSNFPTKFPFTIKIGSEFMKAVSRSGNTYNVERAYLNSTATSHNNNTLAYGSTHHRASENIYTTNAWYRGMDDPTHNLTYTKIIAFITLGLAFGDVDPRARELGEVSFNYWYDYIYPHSKNYWTGATQGGYQYGMNRWLEWSFENAIFLKHAISPAIDITDGNWLKNGVNHYLYNTSNENPINHIRWGDSGALYTIEDDDYKPVIMAQYLFPNTPEAAYAKYWWTTETDKDSIGAMTTHSSQENIPYVLSYITPSQTETSYRLNMDPWKFFTKSDISGEYDSVFDKGYRDYNMVVSKTSWDAYAPTLWAIAFDRPVDHIASYPAPGHYKVIVGNKEIISGGETGGQSFSNPIHSNYLESNAQLLKVSQHVSNGYYGQNADVDREIGNSSYVYFRIESRDSYKTESLVTKSYREFLHDKTGSDSYIVVKDYMTTSSNTQKYRRIHHLSDQASSILEYDQNNLSWGVGDKKVLSKVVAPSDPNYVSILSKKTIGSEYSQTALIDAGNNTEANVLVIHKASNNPSDVMPSITTPSSISNGYIGAVVNDTTPRAYIMAKDGSAYNDSLSFEVSFSGNASIFITNLVSGTYSINKDGESFNDYTVGSDGTMFVTGSQGVYSVARTGSAPQNSIPLISSFSASPSTISSGQSSTLSWSVSNATSLSINQGIGTVTGNSRSVSPNQTTIYTLTATNSSGSATSNATVTVSGDGGQQQDNTPPSVSITNPANNTQVSSAINITANASDNSSLAGVTFKINGNVIGSEDAVFPYTSTLETTGYQNGNYTLLAVARDSSNNLATSSPITVNISNDKNVSGVTVLNLTNNSATISWNTSVPASTILDFGLVNTLGYNTVEKDNIIRVLSHNVDLNNLKPCTKYRFKARSIDVLNTPIVGTGGDFITRGCHGNAEIQDESTIKIDKQNGGNSELKSSNKGLSLVAPEGFIPGSGDGYLQARRISGSDFIAGVTSLNKNIISNHVYTLDFFETPTTTVSSFSKYLDVSISYTDEEVSGIDESTLKIYRYDGTTWYELPNCSVDTDANIITCETNQFSTFVIGGDNSPSVESSGGGGSSGSSGSSSGSTIQTTNFVQNSYQITSNLWKGVRSQEVTALQSILVQLGYTTADNITGYYGSITEAAVKEFQRDNSIVSSGDAISTGYGVVGPKTKMLINSYIASGKYTIEIGPFEDVIQKNQLYDSKITSNLWKGVRSQEVTALQSILVQLGYTTADNITGYYGSITEAAVKEFQRDNSIVSSGDAISTGYGVVGPKTKAKINEYLR